MPLTPSDIELIDSLSEHEINAIRKLICPYCDAGLPETLFSTSAEPYWQHSIPLTSNRFVCLANTLRLRVFAIQESKEPPR